MGIIFKKKDLFIIRFDQNDEVITGISMFCKQMGIQSAIFSAIGACSNIIISYYDLAEKKYIDNEINNHLEIASMNGNVSFLKDELTIHAHGVFTDNNFRAYGGHIKRIIVSATCEVNIKIVDKKLFRKFDINTGLNLLKNAK